MDKKQKESLDQMCEKIKQLTPEELMQTLVDSGIYDENHNLTEKYRSAAEEEHENEEKCKATYKKYFGAMAWTYECTKLKRYLYHAVSTRELLEEIKATGKCPICGNEAELKNA